MSDEKFIAEVADKFLGKDSKCVYNYCGKFGDRHKFTGGASVLYLRDNQVKDHIDLKTRLERYEVSVPELHHAIYVAYATSPEDAMHRIEHGDGEYSHGAEFSNVISSDQLPWSLINRVQENIPYEKILDPVTRKFKWGIKNILKRG